MSDYDASESHEATALIEALRKLPCNNIHYFGQGVCGTCYANVHDGLAKAIHVIRAAARAAGAAEAFERAANVCEDIEARPTHVSWDRGYRTGARDCRSRIRALAEKERGK